MKLVHVHTEVLIVGAGLAGLSTAIHLEAAGVEVTVIESSDRAGGRVASDVIDGFICDRGFQLINAQYPALQELNVIRPKLNTLKKIKTLFFIILVVFIQVR